MLPHADCTQQYPLRLGFGEHASGRRQRCIVPHDVQFGDTEFFLAEQRQLAVLLQAQEVGKPVLADAFGTSGAQQQRR